MIDNHDDMPGAEPGDEPEGERDPIARARAMHEARDRMLSRENWVAEEFAYIEKELMNLNRRLDTRPKGKQPTIFLQSPAEVLDAVKLGVVDKAEARQLLGLKKRRQPKGLRRGRTGGS